LEVGTVDAAWISETEETSVLRPPSTELLFSTVGFSVLEVLEFGTDMGKEPLSGTLLTPTF
jgi:hypothetical protein